MTDCTNNEIRDLLPDMLHETIPVHTRLRVNAHLAGCKACKDELELLSEVHALDPVPEFRRATAAVVVAPSKRGRWTTVPPLMRLAAGLALVALGTASYRIVTNSAQHAGLGGESTFVSVLDSNVPFRLPESPRNLFPASDIALDEQALREILADIEQMDGLLSAEPRTLVQNRIISGDL